MNTWVGSDDATDAAIDTAHQIRKALTADSSDVRDLQERFTADPDLFNAAWYWLTATERRAWKTLVGNL